MRILAIDPGVATGWSEWASTSRESVHLVGVKFGILQYGLGGLLHSNLTNRIKFCSYDYVICEDYHLDGRTPRPNTEPLLIIGAITALCHISNTPLVLQPNTMKRTVGDQKLKDLGLWVTGKRVGWIDGRDVNDSQLHALAWMKINHEPSREFYFHE